MSIKMCQRVSVVDHSACQWLADSPVRYALTQLHSLTLDARAIKTTTNRDLFVSLVVETILAGLGHFTTSC